MLGVIARGILARLAFNGAVEVGNLNIGYWSTITVIET